MRPRAELGVELADDADGVDLHVLLFHELFDVGECVTAAIVFTVRDQQQRLLGIAAFFQLFQTEVYGVVKRGHALGGRENQMVLEARNVGREVLSDFRPFAELDEEVFVVRIARSSGTSRRRRERSEILSFMLPLTSKMMPTLSGTSSAEKYSISCSTLSSQIWKCSFSKPVTYRFRDW